MRISVIIPTYNPNTGRLLTVLDGLRQQTIAPDLWELIIVDNNSVASFEDKIDLSWHRNAKIVTEHVQGLTYARMKGFLETKGDIVILVDDDNLLDENYLKETLNIFDINPSLGTIGGKSLPIFEKEQPEWLSDFHFCLALRDFGNDIRIESWQNKYPDYAPIGAGMAIRKVALKSYIDKITSGKTVITDRKGSSLSSGGDNDIVLEIIKSGWETGYFPSLVLRHIIPNERLDSEYLGKLAKALNKSWVSLLGAHNISPWPKIPGWSVPFRKIKAWFIYAAWKDSRNYIKWKGACGTFEGLAH